MANGVIPSTAVPSVYGYVALNPDGSTIGGGGPGGAGTPAGEQHIGQVGGHLATPASQFTRPADTIPYSVGDLVANSTAAGSVTMRTFSGAARVPDGSFLVRAARLRKSSANLTNAQFRLHLYSTSFVSPANGDNGPWLTAASNNYLGALDITVDRAFSDGSVGRGVPVVGSEISVQCEAGNDDIWGMLEARGAYTPVSGEQFTLTLEVLQN